VALGHWNRAVRVATVPSGLLFRLAEYAGTINVVRLSEAYGVTVSARRRHRARGYGLTRTAPQRAGR